MSALSIVKIHDTLVITAKSAPFDGIEAATMTFAEFQCTALDPPHPSRILCWLFCHDYDALDIAKILKRIDYKGTLCTVSLPLPAQDIIRREIDQIYPGLLIEMQTLRSPKGGHHPYEQLIAGVRILPMGHTLLASSA